MKKRYSQQYEIISSKLNLMKSLKRTQQRSIIDVNTKVVNSFQKKKNDIKLRNMYKYPSNIKLASYHRNANRLGKRPDLNSQLNNKMNFKACPCCENIYVAQEFTMDYSTFIKEPEEGEEKYQLQTGVSLYFTFIKMITIFLLLRFLIFDIVTIYLGVNGHFCSNQFSMNAKDLCTVQVSGYNLNSVEDQQKIYILDILSLIFTIFSITFLIGYRKIEQNQKNRSKSLHFSQQNFSILIENVPTFIYDDYTETNEVHYNYEEYLRFMIESKIKKWISDIQQNKQNIDSLDSLQKLFAKDVLQGSKQDYRSLSEDIVKTISLCYDLTEMENLFKIRDEIIQEYVGDESNIYSAQTSLLRHIPNQIDLLNQEYIRLCQNYIGSSNNTEIGSFKLTHFTGKAFISFQYQHYRDYFLRQYEADKQFFKISGKSISISMANKPNDVHWYNMKITDQERAKATFYAWAVLVMLLTLSLASLIGIELWHRKEAALAPGVTLQDKIRTYLISALMASLTTTINYILSFAIELLSGMQRHKTKSDRMSSLMIKTLITQSINTCFIYMIIFMMEPSNPLGNLGVANKIVSLIIISGLIDLLLSIFIPKHKLMEIIKRCKIKEFGPINMFQIDLNKKLQYPEFQYSPSYSFYIVYSFVVAFYGYLVPSYTALLIIYFFAHYWVDKYNLFKRFSSPVDFSFELRSHILTVFEFSVFLFAFSYLFWDLMTHHDSNGQLRIINLINVFIAGIYSGFSIFASSTLKKKVFRNEDELDSTSYSDYMSDISNKYGAKTFYTENPATSCLTDLSKGKDIETTIQMREIDLTRRKKEVENMAKQQELMIAEARNLERELFNLTAEEKNLQDLKMLDLQRRKIMQQQIQAMLENQERPEKIEERRREVETLRKRDEEISAKADAFLDSMEECRLVQQTMKQSIMAVEDRINREKDYIQEEERQIERAKKFNKLGQNMRQQRGSRCSISNKEVEPDPEDMFINQYEIQTFDPELYKQNLLEPVDHQELQQKVIS